MLAYIFAAGTITNPQSIKINRDPDTLIIAADGGTKHCLAIGVIPDVVIGDFDSMTQEEKKRLLELGTQFIQYPTHKDHTDLELAIRYACQNEVNEIRILGALGQRWDQTLANLMLLVSPDYRCASIRLFDDTQEIFLVTPGENTHIQGDLGDTVSLIPIAGDALGITTKGLEYPLKNETLYLGKTRGVSNVLLENTATVILTSGTLVCIVIHQTVNS